MDHNFAIWRIFALLFGVFSLCYLALYERLVMRDEEFFLTTNLTNRTNKTSYETEAFAAFYKNKC